jgi:hypothetical protein
MLKRNISMNIYLYKKTHRKTRLQYLGITTRSDPHVYSGSGVYWTRHLKEHGYDFDTEILLETSSKEELKEVGLYYSNLWNIVESDSWANLMPEAGEVYMNPITAAKISKTKKGRPAHNKGMKQLHKPRAKETKPRKQYTTQAGVPRPSPLKGTTRPRQDCPHCSKNIDNVNYKRYHGDNCKQR